MMWRMQFDGWREKGWQIQLGRIFSELCGLYGKQRHKVLRKFVSIAYILSAIWKYRLKPTRDFFLGATMAGRAMASTNKSTIFFYLLIYS